MQTKGLRRPSSPSALGQRGTQQALGQQDLAFPQVGERDDEFAPARDVAERVAELAARRLLLVLARLRRIAFEQRAERLAVGMHVQQQRVGQRRRLGPRVVQLREAVRVVGKARGAAEDQRAFAAQCRVVAGVREDARHQGFGLRMALADRQRPGRRQQQPRPPVEFLGGQARRASRAPRRHGRAS